MQLLNKQLPVELSKYIFGLSNSDHRLYFCLHFLYILHHLMKSTCSDVISHQSQPQHLEVNPVSQIIFSFLTFPESKLKEIK